jgi:hypothetical protein
MGAGAGGYVRIKLQTLESSYDPKTDRLHRVSELLFSGAPVPDDPEHQKPPDLGTAPPGPPPGTPPAAKLGLGGVKPKDILDFKLFARLDDDKLAGMGATRNKEVTEELENAFGGNWTGFAVALAPVGGRFRLIADITLKFRCKQKAKRPFQVVPIVMAFGTDRFVDHYLLAIVAAQHTVEKVDTSVTQPY